MQESRFTSSPPRGDGHVRRGWRRRRGRAAGQEVKAQASHSFDFDDFDRWKQLVVLAAFVDAENETVTLRGLNFGKKAPTVFCETERMKVLKCERHGSGRALSEERDGRDVLFTVARGNLDLERGEFYVAKVTSVAGAGRRARAGTCGAAGSCRTAGTCWTQGPAGPAGPAGAVGPAGPAGAAGAAGPAGAAGAVGPAGPAGPRVRPVRWDRRAGWNAWRRDPGGAGTSGLHRDRQVPRVRRARLVGSSATSSSRAIAR